MSTVASLHCPNCTAPLPSPKGARQVRCAHCRSLVELESGARILVTGTASRTCPNPECARLIGSLDAVCPFCGRDVVAEYDRQAQLREQKRLAQQQAETARQKSAIMGRLQQLDAERVELADLVDAYGRVASSRVPSEQDMRLLGLRTTLAARLLGRLGTLVATVLAVILNIVLSVVLLSFTAGEFPVLLLFCSLVLLAMWVAPFMFLGRIYRTITHAVAAPRLRREARRAAAALEETLAEVEQARRESQAQLNQLEAA